MNKKRSVGAAFCLIYSRATDRFLMEFRGRDVGNPNQYGFFGGGIDIGETPTQALIRELREELGISVRVFDYSVQVSKSKPVFLFVKIVKQEFNPQLSWESESYRWVSDIDDVKPLHRKIDAHYGLIRRLMKATRDSCETEKGFITCR